MLPAVQDAAAHPNAGRPGPAGIGPAYGWIVTALVVSLIFVFVFGPGIRIA